MRVIVVGSGIAGMSCAYQLVRQGVRVLVVDAGLSGLATAAGAGIISPWTSRSLAGPTYQLAARAAAYYPELVDQLAEDGQRETSFEIVGALTVAEDPAELDAAYQRATERAAAEPAVGTVRRLDSAEAGALFPPLAAELGAVHVSGAGRVDGRVLRTALGAAIRALSGEFVTGTATLNVAAAGTVRGVQVAGTSYEADAVVVAAGAWSGELLAPLGVRLPIAPQRGQIVHLGLDGRDTSAWPVVQPMSSHYLLAFPGSRVVVGATRETGAGFDYRVTAAGQHQVLGAALRVAPGLGAATVLETRVGFRPAVPDGSAVLGPLPDNPEVLLATGYGASGLTLAPYGGAVLAELAVGRPAPIDLTPFRPERLWTTTG
ncbi:D-amino-acid dehydrogenase [Tamaricihabitans halophyticus]|uniref:D-amino-acid dehydrogenase n=1 Tax=Tamaricihabitans halophyticus TaxID=1262583 RepID=A0A4R2QDM2_9PSEU|nr:FAD-dependent oxidoreductase [Tamaricihabitans halophyticus]TCP46729.1 D-amino-acid dehydrogenase [Tamaricihabitans halophyticus]